MRTIYIDSDFKCHTTNGDMWVAIKTNFFDDKCDAFVEGYCCEIKEDYTIIYPWKDYSELIATQHEYEKEQLSKINIKLNELNTSYTEGVNSI